MKKILFLALFILSYLSLGYSSFAVDTEIPNNVYKAVTIVVYYEYGILTREQVETLLEFDNETPWDKNKEFWEKAYTKGLINQTQKSKMDKIDERIEKKRERWSNVSKKLREEDYSGLSEKELNKAVQLVRIAKYCNEGIMTEEQGKLFSYLEVYYSDDINIYKLAIESGLINQEQLSAIEKDLKEDLQNEVKREQETTAQRKQQLVNTLQDIGDIFLERAKEQKPHKNNKTYIYPSKQGGRYGSDTWVVEEEQ